MSWRRPAEVTPRPRALDEGPADVNSAHLEAGRRELGIVYGAAHLVDMQERLLLDLGFTPESRRWLVAWRLTDAAVEPPADVADLRPLYGADARA
jgi:hypothetical protein